MQGGGWCGLTGLEAGEWCCSCLEPQPRQRQGRAERGHRFEKLGLSDRGRRGEPVRSLLLQLPGLPPRRPAFVHFAGLRVCHLGPFLAFPGVSFHSRGSSAIGISYPEDRSSGVLMPSTGLRRGGDFYSKEMDTVKLRRCAVHDQVQKPKNHRAGSQPALKPAQVRRMQPRPRFRPDGEIREGDRMPEAGPVVFREMKLPRRSGLLKGAHYMGVPQPSAGPDLQGLEQ